jgi:predicted membrane protein (TIGR00267 family)
MELGQLRDMFLEMGISESDVDGVVSAFDRSDEAMLGAMKALEFGVVESERRSPVKAMVMSGLLFLVGAMPSVLPFVFLDETGPALALAAVLSLGGLFLVGVVKARVTKGNIFSSGVENMAVAGIGGLVAWFIGDAVGTTLS